MIKELMHWNQCFIYSPFYLQNVYCNTVLLGYLTEFSMSLLQEVICDIVAFLWNITRKILHFSLNSITLLISFCLPHDLVISVVNCCLLLVQRVLQRVKASVLFVPHYLLLCCIIVSNIFPKFFMCCGFNPLGQLTPQSCSLTPSPAGWGRQSKE